MNTADKDVQEQLAKDRRRKRAPGESVYPLEYSRDAADFDNWEHDFMITLNQGLTMWKFETPPERVLDLGCGAGLWVMEAATAWPHSTFVGLDVKDIQPDLDCRHLPNQTKDIFRRIKWTHANFLDKLPLASDHFDFVRVSRIGLGVPEDEWPDILQEIHRVLRPNGILEIIEEDLIFPRGYFPLPPPPPSPSPSSDIPLLRSSHGNLSAQSTPARPAPRTSATSSFIGGNARNFKSEQSFNSGASAPGRPPQPLVAGAPAPTPLDVNQSDPRDHSRLQHAWEALIARRFLARQPPSVLPLYLSSTFASVQSYAPVHVPLPLNSVRKWDSTDELGLDDEEDEDMGDEPGEADSSAAALDPRASLGLSVTAQGSRTSFKTPPTPPRPRRRTKDPLSQLDDVDPLESSAPMHLARVVNTIEGCKDALFSEYSTLFGGLEEFEHDWENWICDMQDRIGLRSLVCNGTGWIEPTDDPDHGPSWRQWRNNLLEEASPTSAASTGVASGAASSTTSTSGASQDRRASFLSSEPASVNSSRPPAIELCRSWRGFVAFKAKLPVPSAT